MQWDGAVSTVVLVVSNNMVLNSSSRSKRVYAMGWGCEYCSTCSNNRVLNSGGRSKRVYALGWGCEYR